MLDSQLSRVMASAMIIFLGFTVAMIALDGIKMAVVVWGIVLPIVAIAVILANWIAGGSL